MQNKPIFKSLIGICYAEFIIIGNFNSTIKLLFTGVVGFWVSVKSTPDLVISFFSFDNSFALSTKETVLNPSPTAFTLAEETLTF